MISLKLPELALIHAHQFTTFGEGTLRQRVYAAAADDDDDDYDDDDDDDDDGIDDCRSLVTRKAVVLFYLNTNEHIHSVSKNCVFLFLSELRQISTNFNKFW